jgi:hypothetical protein
MQTTNKWFPEATQQDPEGLYILQSLPPPNRELLPQEFTSDSRSGFDATFRKIQELYTNLQPEVVRQWEEFALSVPSNDSVQDHLRDHPDSMHIPFRDLLFSFSPEEGSANNNSAIQLGDDFQSSRKRKDIQMQQLRSTDSVSWSRRNKKLRKNDPNSGLRVANDCPPAIYESKSNNNRRKNKTTTDSSSPQSETSLNNSSRKKTSSSSSRSQIVKKTNRRKKTCESSSESESDSEASDHSCSSNSTNNCTTDGNNSRNNSGSENSDDDDHHSDAEKDNCSIASNRSGDTTSSQQHRMYETDDEKLDKDQYYHRRKNVQVARYGSALPYIDKVFQLTNSSGSRNGTIKAVVSCTGDPTNTLYFKFYDQTLYKECPDSFSSTTTSEGHDALWQYIKCSELMGSKKGLKWIGGANPGGVGGALVGMMVRRPFKIDKNWIWFNGHVSKYLNKGHYEVTYEDGDVLPEKELDVVKFLMYTF